jgi:hypothetical protein
MNIRRVCLRGAHVCVDSFQGDARFVIDITWILATAWESLRIVSCSLDCCKTLPRTAAAIIRMDCRGLLHDINKDSCVLLRKVYLWLERDFLSSLRFTLVILSCLPFSWSVCLQCSMYANLWLISASDHFNRTHLLCYRVSLLAFFTLPEACRCLYRSHVSSLEFENIMRTSSPTSPTPTKELAWLRLFSRSAYTFQLTVVCNRGKFVLITLFGTLWQAFLVFLGIIFVVIFVGRLGILFLSFVRPGID